MNDKDKILAKDAYQNGDLNKAMEVCRQIATQDLYLNVPKPQPTRKGMETVARWGDRPCKNGCGHMITPGERVWWEPNWGISHIECP